MRIKYTVPKNIGTFIADDKDMKIRHILYIIIPFLLLTLLTCKPEKVPEPYQPTHAHDAYLHSLNKANLAETALGRDWITSSNKALNEPITISTPFEEFFYIDPAEAFAVGYRFDAIRGQRIEVDVDVQGLEIGRLFIDLFRVRGVSSEEWVRVASADTEENRLEFEPRRDAQYVIRLQSELLRGGQCKVTIRNVAALEFPVAGYDIQAIGSGFGAPRDGGRRRHHGVDVFAPRHTPVVAASRAYVVYVGDDPTGGRVIWLKDSKRSLHIYYAHLEKQDVKRYTWVDPGQVIGTVGNTGNARTTPPHLHFGMYEIGYGPIDPIDYIIQPSGELSPLTADLGALGQWMRVQKSSLNVNISYESPSERIISLDSYSPMMVLAAAGKKYRVRLPNGKSGYIPASSVESIEQTLEHQAVSFSQPIKESPREDAAAIELVRAGERFSVLAKYREYWLVKTRQGNIGWLQVHEAAPSAN
ncbi:MAG: M23 family metallopeptidase [Candidatus Aminicenantes bacterium]|nr:M23 family metallopeptidase [Candidatus Aminicenantes bacterium]